MHRPQVKDVQLSPPRLVVTNRRIEITAIEYGDTVVTVTSRFVGDQRLSSKVRPMPYVTSIPGLSRDESGRAERGADLGQSHESGQRGRRSSCGEGLNVIIAAARVGIASRPNTRPTLAFRGSV